MVLFVIPPSGPNPPIVFRICLPRLSSPSRVEVLESLDNSKKKIKLQSTGRPNSSWHDQTSGTDPYPTRSKPTWQTVQDLTEPLGVRSVFRDPFATGADPDPATFGRAVLFQPGYGQEPNRRFPDTRRRPSALFRVCLDLRSCPAVRLDLPLSPGQKQQFATIHSWKDV